MNSTTVQDAIKQVAAGEPVRWEQDFEHPIYGVLTARVKDMPRNRDWLAHAARQDTLIREFGGNPNDTGNGTNMLAAALAGFQIIFEPITVKEDRQEDPESGHEIIEKTFYDPLDDEDPTVALEVWLRFWAWRQALLAGADDVGKSSAAMSGPESAGSSREATDSPSTILV